MFMFYTADNMFIGNEKRKQNEEKYLINIMQTNIYWSTSILTKQKIISQKSSPTDTKITWGEIIILREKQNKNQIPSWTDNTRNKLMFKDT